ncbi:Uncharacterised protein [Actinomadura madurae]|nr:Uncharacterised protein [Actinomadura madurae]
MKGKTVSYKKPVLKVHGPHGGAPGRRDRRW